MQAEARCWTPSKLRGDELGPHRCKAAGGGDRHDSSMLNHGAVVHLVQQGAKELWRDLILPLRLMRLMMLEPASQRKSGEELPRCCMKQFTSSATPVRR